MFSGYIEKWAKKILSAHQIPVSLSFHEIFHQCYCNLNATYEICEHVRKITIAAAYLIDFNPL